MANLTKQHNYKIEGLDELSRQYNDFIDGTYDCIDRFVLNAWHPLGQSPGGFRT